MSKGRQKIPLSFVAILFTTLSTKKQLEVKSSTIFGELSNVCVVLVLDSALFRSITVLCHGVIWIAKKTALLSKSVYQRTRSTVGSERHYCFHALHGTQPKDASRTCCYHYLSYTSATVLMNTSFFFQVKLMKVNFVPPRSSAVGHECSGNWPLKIPNTQ